MDKKTIRNLEAEVRNAPDGEHSIAIPTADLDSLLRVRRGAETARHFFDTIAGLRATGYDERAFRKAQGHAAIAAVDLVAALDNVSEEDAFRRWLDAAQPSPELIDPVTECVRLRAQLAATRPLLDASATFAGAHAVMEAAMNGKAGDVPSAYAAIRDAAEAARALNRAALLAAPRAEAGDQIGDRTEMVAPTGGPAADEPGRCEVCGWALAKSVEDGCVPGNCSYRPDEGSDEWHRIQRRRAALAAPTGGAGTGEGR